MQNRLSQFKITQRNNYYVLREQDKNGEVTEWMKKVGHNVVFHRESVGDKNGQKLNGIRGVYQIRVNNSMEQQYIKYRDITCACIACVQSNYAFGETNSTWTAKNLRREVVDPQAQTRIEAQEHRIDPEADRAEERLQRRFEIGGMTVTWAQNADSTIRLGLQRGKRISNRDKRKAIEEQSNVEKRNKN